MGYICLNSLKFTYICLNWSSCSNGFTTNPSPGLRPPSLRQAGRGQGEGFVRPVRRLGISVRTLVNVRPWSAASLASVSAWAQRRCTDATLPYYNGNTTKNYKKILNLKRGMEQEITEPERCSCAGSARALACSGWRLANQFLLLIFSPPFSQAGHARPTGAITGRSYRLKGHSAIAGKDDKNRKTKSKSNESSTAEPAS